MTEQLKKREPTQGEKLVSSKKNVRIPANLYELANDIRSAQHEINSGRLNSEFMDYARQLMGQSFFQLMVDNVIKVKFGLKGEIESIHYQKEKRGRRTTVRNG